MKTNANLLITALLMAAMQSSLGQPSARIQKGKWPLGSKYHSFRVFRHFRGFDRLFQVHTRLTAPPFGSTIWIDLPAGFGRHLEI